MFAATVFLKRKGLKKYLIRVECCLLFVEVSREKASNQPHFALRAGLPKDKNDNVCCALAGGPPILSMDCRVVQAHDCMRVYYKCTHYTKLTGKPGGGFEFDTGVFACACNLIQCYNSGIWRTYTLEGQDISVIEKFVSVGPTSKYGLICASETWERGNASNTSHQIYVKTAK